jgi:hypothetical protein
MEEEGVVVDVGWNKEEEVGEGGGRELWRQREEEEEQ